MKKFFILFSFFYIENFYSVRYMLRAYYGVLEILMVRQIIRRIISVIKIVILYFPLFTQVLKNTNKLFSS